MKRKIISIDEDKCNGCGLCVTGCAEGAIQIIDGKARVVNDAFCDGLGACIGECPEGALSIVEREADPFDEKQVAQALARAKHSGAQSEKTPFNILSPAGGCPGSQSVTFAKASSPVSGAQVSELSHWPVQLHLVNPAADFFRGRDVVLAADCAAFAAGNFHEKFLKGKSLAIACPKLDDGQEVYIDKIRRMADEAQIRSLTVVMMQVPCCRGLLELARTGLGQAARNVPLKTVIIGISGNILAEE